MQRKTLADRLEEARVWARQKACPHYDRKTEHRVEYTGEGQPLVRSTTTCLDCGKKMQPHPAFVDDVNQAAIELLREASDG